MQLKSQYTVLYIDINKLCDIFLYIIDIDIIDILIDINIQSDVNCTTHIFLFEFHRNETRQRVHRPALLDVGSWGRCLLAFVWEIWE